MVTSDIGFVHHNHINILFLQLERGSGNWSPTAAGANISTQADSPCSEGYASMRCFSVPIEPWVSLTHVFPSTVRRLGSGAPLATGDLWFPLLRRSLHSYGIQLEAYFIPAQDSHCLV